MSMILDFLNETELTFPVIAFRLILGFILGGIIGYEREGHNQPAGFRTHILITMGSAMLMLLSIYVPRTLGMRGINGIITGDPGRIAAQVVSGIGFLGAGAILKLGVNVRGVTTAASIWTVAALGLVVGAGMYATALFGTALIMFVLVVLDQVEKKFS